MRANIYLLLCCWLLNGCSRSVEKADTLFLNSFPKKVNIDSICLKRFGSRAMIESVCAGQLLLARGSSLQDQIFAVFDIASGTLSEDIASIGVGYGSYFLKPDTVCHLSIDSRFYVYPLKAGKWIKTELANDGFNRSSSYYSGQKGNLVFGEGSPFGASLLDLSIKAFLPWPETNLMRPSFSSYSHPLRDTNLLAAYVRKSSSSQDSMHYFCIDLGRKLLWTRAIPYLEMDADFSGGIIYSEQRFFVYAGKTLTALSALDGAVLWTKPLRDLRDFFVQGGSLYTVVGKKLYRSNGIQCYQTICRINPKDGSQLAVINRFLNGPNVCRLEVYSNSKGLFYADEDFEYRCSLFTLQTIDSVRYKPSKDIGPAKWYDNSSGKWYWDINGYVAWE